METLEAQIEKLKAEHAFKSDMETLLGGYRPLAYLSKSKDYNYTINIDLTNWPREMDISGQLKNIVNILKSTKDTQVYDPKIKITHYSPFQMQWQSNIKSNEVLISYISKDILVRISMPISFYKAIAKQSFRAPNDTEDVYFEGVSRAEINRMRIPVYQSLYYDNLAWYGGNYTTYIKDAEYREQFDNMVLTGELPLG